MKVTVERVAPVVRFEDFADQHGLEIIVRERTGRFVGTSQQFYAQFPDSETKESRGDGCLTGTYGDGATPEDAIIQYAEELRGRLLVINATGGDKRREIQCPTEWL